MMETTSITAVLFRQTSKEGRFSDTVEVDRCRMLNFKFCVEQPQVWAVLNFIFAATNAPDDFLTEEHRWIRQCFASAGLYSVSVGDVIQLDDRYFICCNFEWKEINNFQETYNQD
jgi:hypothetical protein